MSQATIFNASPAGHRMREDYNQGWAVAAHNFEKNEVSLICGCFSDTPGGEAAAQESATFIAQMLNLREETGLTYQQIRATLLSAPKMQAAIHAAFESGMVPSSSVSDGGASKHSAQVKAADQLREAMTWANHAKG